MFVLVVDSDGFSKKNGGVSRRVGTDGSLKANNFAVRQSISPKGEICLPRWGKVARSDG